MLWREQLESYMLESLCLRIPMARKIELRLQGVTEADGSDRDLVAVYAPIDIERLEGSTTEQRHKKFARQIYFAILRAVQVAHGRHRHAHRR